MIFDNLRGLRYVYIAMERARKHLIRPVILLLALLPMMANAQCPNVFDFNGQLVANPFWYSCNGENFTLNLQSPNNWNGYEINWGDGSPNTTGANWNSPSIISHTYSAAVATYNITITEVFSGCVVNGTVVMEESTSASIQIPVGGLTQACAPQQMEFINSSTNVSDNTTFTWNFGDGSPPLVFDHTNWQQMIAHMYEQNTVDCETVVTLTAENYCNTIQGGPSVATFSPIRIWDIDDAAITASATLLCYPDTTVTFTNTTQRNCLFQGNIFQRYEYWNFGDYWGQGTDSIIDWTPWPPTFPQTVGFPGIGTYEVTMLDSNFCGIDTARITIQIVPPPTAALAASADTICVGEPVTFFQQSSGGGNQFAWDLGTGLGWLPTGGGNITFVYNAPGTYTVCTRVSVQGASAGCSDIACLDVVVLPAPNAVISASDVAGCDSLEVTFTNLSTGAQTSSWTFDVAPFSFNGTNPPPINYPQPGNYVVNLTVEGLNGCLDNTQQVIRVYNSPQADFIANNVCEGTQAQFTDISTPDPGDPILSWFWDFGDGSTSNLQHPTHTYLAIGSYDITLTVTTANCSDQITQTISVEPAPIPSIGLDVDEGCSPLTVNFENNTTGAVSYQWIFSDGAASTLPEPTHTFLNLSDADAVYWAVMNAFTEFGCAASDSLPITVYPGAIAGFTDNSLPPSCAPFEATFINTSQGADNYLWDFGDGNTSTDESPNHLYSNLTGFVQTFQVTLIAYKDNGCNDTTSSNVIVYPSAVFSFAITPDTACSPLITTMPFIQGINLYEWDFGDGSPISNMPTPTHMWTNQTLAPITYTVNLTGTSAFGCTGTASAEVVVDPQPIAQGFADTNSGCSPLLVNFQNLSIQADNYIWIYSDGDTSYTAEPIHSHLFDNQLPITQVYEVQLIAQSANGCSDTFTIPIEVFPQITAGFIAPQPGCTPYPVSFLNTTQNASSYTWDFGNGIISTQQNPSTVFTNTTLDEIVYTVTLTANSPNGCSDVATADVVVNPVPEAAFSMSNNEGCHPSPAVLTNTSAEATSFNWDYGNGTGSSVAAPEHTYAFTSVSGEPVTYIVTLTAFNDAGCSAEASLPYTVFPNVVSSFTTGDGGCSPVQLTFSNQSLGATAGFTWDFGNGTTSSQNNPTTTFINSGGQDTTYTVMLVASSIYGCADTSFVDVDVFGTPIAIAEIDTTIGCYPLDVVFSNQSVGADSFQWVYGTGEVSEISDIEHTHTYFNLADDPVTYNITLNAYTNSGCSSSDQLSITVLPVLEADATANQVGCSPLTVNFQNESNGALSYFWDFGDGNTHTMASPVHTYTNTTTEDVTYEAMLVASSTFGCNDTTYIDITVYAVPEANFTATPQNQQFPETTIDLTNLSTAGQSAEFFWAMGNGSVLEGENPGNYDFGTWGVFTITLEVDNGFCSDSFTQTIEIDPPSPIADFIGPASGCVPLTVVFEDQSDYATGWNWVFGDGGTATVANPVYTYNQPGTYTVSLTVNGIAPGSNDQIVQESIIEVYPRAAAFFTVTPDELSVPGQPLFTVNASQNATTYFWDFGDGTTSTEFAPEHYYQVEGIYSISLTANNEFDCPSTYSVADAVYARPDADIVFPNAFTPPTSGPNGGVYDPDGYTNDVFFPLQKGVTEYNLQIFNKWGELLFESTDINIGWDGYYKGQICKQDVYAWKVKARFSNGETITKAGDVTLLPR